MGFNLGAKLAVLVLVTTFGSFAHAQGIQIGQPVSGGSGCPGGTLVASIQNGRIHLSFDQYVAEAGRPSGRTLDRKTCNVAVPIRLPAGTSISILSIDYLGFADIPKGGKGQLTTESFFVGSKGSKVVKPLPVGAARLFRINETTRTKVWSACGADTILRVNTSLLVQSNSKKQQALATVDTARATGGVFYNLAVKSCL